MNWTRPPDLRAQVQKLWDKGLLLSELINEDLELFPKRLILKAPNSTEMLNRFDDVRVWITEIHKTPYCRIETREFAHRVLGANAIPNEVWIDNLDAALRLIGKRQEAARFRAVIEITRKQQPLLLDYLAKRPLRALELSEQWQHLLDIVTWMQAHPHPDIYLRQVDIPGIHSKFIENYRAVLTELFDKALPPETINFTGTGVNQFATRYGFRNKPIRIRFRMLDSERTLLPGGGVQDMTLDADSFTHLQAPVSRVFITENETNYLAFPPIKDSLIIFGAGYGWESLEKALWLSNCAIYYWGDIDTHGFAILNQLRNRFNHVESFLMDRETLLNHQSLWGQEKEQSLCDLSGLSTEESALFDDLRDNRIRKNLRLEQEMIGFGWLELALNRLTLNG